MQLQGVLFHAIGAATRLLSIATKLCALVFKEPSPYIFLSGSNGLNRGSRKYSPIHTRIPHSTGAKNGCPACTCVAVAPPRYAARSTAPNTDVCGMT